MFLFVIILIDWQLLLQTILNSNVVNNIDFTIVPLKLYESNVSMNVYDKN